LEFRLTWRCGIWVCAALVFATLCAAAAEPKRVLLLNSYGRDFAPWSEYSRDLRAELVRQLQEPVDIFDASLATARFSANSEEERPFVDYLRALFSEHRLDLALTIGAPAATFLQQHRQQLFPSTPILLTGLEQRRVATSTLSADESVVATAIDLAGVVENILKLIPDTANIAVVIGNSPTERYWLEQIRGALEPFTKRVAFTYFNDLAFDEMLKRAASLPPRSAIFYALLSVDAAGVPHEQETAMTSLHAVANAPMFSYLDAYLGLGIVGGPLISARDVSERAAGIAVRILQGEIPGNIKTASIGAGSPVYDWRELGRWGIAEARLPSGSEVLFTEPTAWQRYRWQIIFVSAVLAVQMALIIGLFYERRNRRSAEAASRSAIGMSASIAHEINQPLAAIVINANAGLRWLSTKVPDLGEARAALERVVSDGHRAGEVIGSVRRMFKKESGEDESIDLNEIIQDVLRILRAELQRQGVDVQTGLTTPLPPLLGHTGQLHQVFMNLVKNAAEAMESVSDRARILSVKSEFREADGVVVSVEDTGTGIDPKHIDHIFDSFFTTKPEGMGMGLSVCRSIIEAHGGRLSASNGAVHGSIFSVKFPASRPGAKWSVTSHSHD
jgi:signal transduction histidine kinase